MKDFKINNDIFNNYEQSKAYHTKVYLTKLNAVYDYVDVKFSYYVSPDNYILVGKDFNGIIKYGILLGGTINHLLVPVKYDSIEKVKIQPTSLAYTDKGISAQNEYEQGLKFTVKTKSGKVKERTISEFAISLQAEIERNKLNNAKILQEVELVKKM